MAGGDARQRSEGRACVHGIVSECTVMRGLESLLVGGVQREGRRGRGTSGLTLWLSNQL